MTNHAQPKSQDMVVLVNQFDEVIGEMDKIEAHRGEGKRHRAISVYLFSNTRSDAELLIQQRSRKKIVGAEQWANSVCGNVRPNESYEDCAYRRLKEELGITEVEIMPLYTFEYHLQCNEEFSEWEMDQVYIGRYTGKVLPNPDEVQHFHWVKWLELLEKERQAQLLIQEFATKKILIDEKSITLAPWFVFMLGDKKLITCIHNYLIQ